MLSSIVARRSLTRLKLPNKIDISDASQFTWRQVARFARDNCSRTGKRSTLSLSLRFSSYLSLYPRLPDTRAFSQPCLLASFSLVHRSRALFHRLLIPLTITGLKNWSLARRSSVTRITLFRKVISSRW